MTLNLTANLGAEPLNAVINLDRGGALFSGGESAVSANVSLGDAVAVLDGQLDLGGATILLADVQANIPDTGDLMVAAGFDDPNLPQDFGQSVSATANLAFTDGALQVSDLDLGSGQTALAGELEVQLSGNVPLISGALAADVLDLSAFASEEEVEGAEPGAGGSRDPRIETPDPPVTVVRPVT